MPLGRPGPFSPEKPEATPSSLHGPSREPPWGPPGRTGDWAGHSLPDTIWARFFSEPLHFHVKTVSLIAALRLPDAAG